MKTKILIQFVLVFFLMGSYSCMKKDITNQVIGQQPPVDQNDDDDDIPDVNPESLKAVANFPIGFGVDHSNFLNNVTYANIVKENADVVAFGYDFKHGAVVANSGTLNFTNADQMYNKAKDLGLDVYGHTLVWHQNQNATYLKAVAAGTASGSAGVVAGDGPVVIFSDDFESFTDVSNAGNSGKDAKAPAGWTILNMKYSTFAEGSGAKNVSGGSHSLALEITDADPDPKNYLAQIESPQFNVKPGHDYQVVFQARATGSDAKWQLEWKVDGQGVNYTGDRDIPLTFTEQSANFSVPENANTTAKIAFDMGLNPAGVTTYIDDLKIIDLTSDDDDDGELGTPAEEVEKAMKTWIAGMVGHYKGKLTGWDVVNEPVGDDGVLRNTNNTNLSASDAFLWSEYVDDYAVKAFNYAHDADPAAKLFINEYNLETSDAKLATFLELVQHIKDAGAPIDGVGTQMHINITTSNEKIDNAFKQLAATGLLVRVSELDIKVNTATPDNATLQQQAEKYAYVAQSYKQNVPPNQQAGFVIWGVGDGDSWINDDAPLLYDKDYKEKPSFDALYNAFKN